jgi:hypothetical protein
VHYLEFFTPGESSPWYCGSEPPSVEDLMKAIELEWEAVSKEELEHLVESMPRRCSAVIEAKGWHTKY